MSDTLLIIALLTAATFSIRFLGVVLGQYLPTSGPWARALNALPGCLIVALLTVMLAKGDFNEWIGASAALTIAMITRSLLLTMLTGIGAVWLLRIY